MSGPGEAGSLQRAHTLSSQASQVLHDPSPSIATLTSALEAYREAADLFSHASASSGTDPGTLKTLQLLTAQHKKLVRDIERRIALVHKAPSTVAHPNLRRAATVPAPSPGGAFAISHGRDSGERRPTSPIKRPNEPTGLAAIGVSPSPFFASSTAAPRTSPAPAIGGRALPPFAQRPIPHATPFADHNPNLAPASHQPTISPLYSSSSSSEPDPAESYITFGLGLGVDPRRHGGREIDPFSRFWGMLEECLDEVSRPVAFASAPMGDSQAKGKGGQNDGKEEGAVRVGSIRGKDRKTVKDSDINRTASPSDSYCMIPSETATSSAPRKDRRSSASAKTPEELILENESLRASLDALAVHTQQVDEENRELRLRSKEREAALRTVAAGVRKEAVKARLDTSVLLRSQVLPVDPSLRQSGHARPDPRRLAASQLDQAEETAKLRSRLGELEDEVNVLKVENEKHKVSAARYKARYAKLKLETRAKPGA